MVEWNRVTWYSKLLAVILFIGIIPAWTFYVGTQYEQTALALEDTSSVSAAASSSSIPKGDAGIKGTVTLGPTCPVERIPPDPTCADRPYQTTLIVTPQSGKNSGTAVKTDANGNYSVTLAPGTYVIQAQSQSSLPRLEPINVLVQPHSYTLLNFSFDSGIR